MVWGVPTALSTDLQRTFPLHMNNTWNRNIEQSIKPVHFLMFLHHLDFNCNYVDSAHFQAKSIILSYTVKHIREAHPIDISEEIRKTTLQNIKGRGMNLEICP